MTTTPTIQEVTGHEAALAAPGEYTVSRIWVVVATRDAFAPAPHDYCVRAYSSEAIAREHARLAGAFAAEAEAYKCGSPRSSKEYLSLVYAAIPGLIDADPRWLPGAEAPTRYRVEPLELETTAQRVAEPTHRVVVHRAHPTGDQIVPRSVIEIDPTVPDPRKLPDRRPDEYPSDAIMAEDARDLLGALTQSLPGGTLDRLTVLLLQRKVSHFIVRDP
jgi:hypothetical protein